MHKPQSPVCFTICSETIKTYIFNSHRYSTFGILSKHLHDRWVPLTGHEGAPCPSSVWLLVAVDVLFLRGWTMKLTSSFHILLSVSRQSRATCWVSLLADNHWVYDCKTTLSWNSRGWWWKAAQIGCLATIHDLIIHNKWAFTVVLFTWTSVEDGSYSPCKPLASSSTIGHNNLLDSCGTVKTCGITAWWTVLTIKFSEN